MKVMFNEKEYKKNGRNGKALKNLCFDIFKQYLNLHSGLTYKDLQDTFNQWHCNNNFVVLSEPEWENKTEDLKKRYFSPVKYNDNDIYFTTQWGNNGGDCDNINNMIEFAKEQKYNIKIISNNTKISTNKNLNIKNIILYGAPGVGKTHNYQNLISMIEDGKTQNDIFTTISQNNKVELDNDIFKTIKEEKRVEFVTFHQSYSYEDFIEGFRPNETGNIELEDGIFKNLSDTAKDNLEDSKKSTQIIENEQNFDNLLEEFKIYIQDKIDSDDEFILKGKSTISSVTKNAFIVGGSVRSTQNLSFNILKRDYDDFKNNLIKSYKDIKSTFESKSGIHGNAPYYFALYEKVKEFENNSYDARASNNIKQVEQKNYYIVIDEINRGNISKIFGELITLIEEDKRDAYEVTLPYSKEKFKVPSNLYIIATMNSTDKSIATIDIALRRRFTFLKMQPNENLIDNADARKLFNDLNTFIADNLSEDYKLGHSYFMKIEDASDLEFVKEYKIKPLLEEYFYADDKNYEEALKILNFDMDSTNE